MAMQAYIINLNTKGVIMAETNYVQLFLDTNVNEAEIRQYPSQRRTQVIIDENTSILVGFRDDGSPFVGVRVNDEDYWFNDDELANEEVARKFKTIRKARSTSARKLADLYAEDDDQL